MVCAKELFRLTPAAELKVLTEANEIVSKENALKSKAYNRLLAMITEGSLEGRYSIEFELYPDEDVYMLRAFKEVLNSVGYKVSFHSVKVGLFVSWD